MTTALCLNCGDIKFGAICPCPNCQVKSCGDMDVDIAFSDHNCEVETLEEFGSVIKAIRAACDDGPTRYWAFMHYISEHHPRILRADLKPPMRDKVTQLLEGLVLPEVKLRASPEKRVKQEDDTSGPPHSSPSPQPAPLAPPRPPPPRDLTDEEDDALPF